MPRTGRPTKLTPALTAAFCGRLAEGLSRTRAAAAVGVTKKTICAWLKLGRSGRSSVYAGFLADVLAAEARFVADQLAVVVRAAGPRTERITRTTTRPDGAVTVEVVERPAGDWRAAMWLLECKDPDGFGSDRRELAELRKELAEVRRSIAATSCATPSGGAEPG